MTKTMLIDAAHTEETRVVVVAGQEIEDFDVETKAKQQLRGNIYLAKVTRVEPSLQACFVDFGNIRHGFLAFSEVHPDYYQIPIADREALLAEEAMHVPDELADDEEEASRQRRAQNRKYKIQDVLKRRQIMLVQPVKEVRGNKGAALTTYLSLAGRYCVLMPNTPRGGGISRKISAAGDRKRLKSIVSSLEVPKGMGLIIRTAGAKRNKTEIKRDYEYLLRLWDDIRTRTLESVAPCLIHEEESLVKRAIRDLYNKDVGSIIIEGEHAYKEAKEFVKMLIPSHARKVHQYKNSTPLFSRLGIDSKLADIHSGVVQLKSGGYVVINQTEALVAIDVNSGKSTRERSIEQTALKTNLEAATEIARQMRMRDLAGLIVIDFIDMEEQRNDRLVEKRMKDALRLDRARVQMGKISPFGLMEISRQRRRAGILEGSSHTCPHCAGFGRVRSPSSVATQIIREIESQSGGRRGCEIDVTTDLSSASYLLNEKRRHLAQLESARGIIVRVIADNSIANAQYVIEFVNHGEEIDEPDFNYSYIKEIENSHPDEIEELEGVETEDDTDDETETVSVSRNKRRRQKRRSRRNENTIVETQNDSDVVTSDETEEASENTEEANEEKSEENTNRNRRRRGRRLLRNRRDRKPYQERKGEAPDAPLGETVATAEETILVEPVAVESQTDEVAETKPKKRPSRAKKPKAEKTDESASIAEKVTVSENAPQSSEAVSEPSKENPKTPKPRKTGWWARNASKLFGSESESNEGES